MKKLTVVAALAIAAASFTACGNQAPKEATPLVSTKDRVLSNTCSR